MLAALLPSLTTFTGSSLPGMQVLAAELIAMAAQGSAAAPISQAVNLPAVSGVQLTAPTSLLTTLALLPGVGSAQTL